MPVRAAIREDSQNRAVLSAMLKMPARMTQEIGKETDRIMLDVLRDSKTKPPKVPVDTGSLQSTGRVEPARANSAGVVLAELLYGGAEGVDYAVYVHENVGAQFKRPGAGAKFVEAHFRRRSQEIPDRLEAAAARGLK